MLSSIVSILGIFLPVIQVIFRFFRISVQNQEAFIKKIQATKNDGLVSIQAKDEFKQLDEELNKPITPVEIPSKDEPKT